MRFFAPAVAALAVFLPARAMAYPEMIRHGYTQCTACHVSPNGGNLLNAYGKQLAGELLSTWSYEGEGGILHGAVKDPAEKGVILGGDVRSIQVAKENATLKEGRFFLMQAEADGAYVKDHFTAYISVGQITRPEIGHVEGNLYSTRYYGLLQVTDQFSVRAGHFMPQFGLNTTEHELVIKDGLGLTPGLEFDSVEAAWLGERWTVFLTAAQTAPNTPLAGQERARVLHVAYTFSDRYKTGFSYWHGDLADNEHREIYSLNEMFGFTPRFFTLTEVDYQRDSTQKSVFATSRWGYEVHKGIVPYLQYQYSLVGTAPERHYAGGAQIFPRPHFEVAGQWDEIRTNTGKSRVAYVLLHYYF